LSVLSAGYLYTIIPSTAEIPISWIGVNPFHFPVVRFSFLLP
jgi:hypothetical protein